MDKNKIYCPICNKELTNNNNNKYYEYQCDCYDDKKFKYISQWCEDCQKFTSRRGTHKGSKCCRCAVRLQHKTMKENDPEGYAKRQTAASIKANEKMKTEGKGIWDPETHKLIEATKLKNGTSLSNPEFRKKIGCNGNSPEVQKRLKNQNLGIYSDKCLELKTKRFTEYWQTEKWKKEDKIRKQKIVKNQWIFESNIKCNQTCKGLKNIKCNKSCLKNIYGWCREKQIEMSGIKQSNFIVKNNVRYYKEKILDQLCNDLLNEKENISNYPGFSIRFGKVCYHGIDVLTDEKILLNNSNFTERNDILYYYDKSINQYVPWEDYKLKFSRMRTTSEINNFIKKLKALEIFQPKHMGPMDSYDLNDIIQLLPTFRTQDSQDWTGAKNAFEQSLVDADIHWFTYIKFYIDNKKKTEDAVIRPLVVGKSGSLLVNNSGSDLSFSTDINDGPARKFLNDENLQWDKTQILIIKAKSERQALFYEWKIADVYELFES